MGADESKPGSPCYGLMGPSSVVSNMNKQAQMARAWALLHQCSLEQWKFGHGGEFKPFEKRALNSPTVMNTVYFSQSKPCIIATIRHSELKQIVSCCACIDIMFVLL